jgi:hypothetical protein
MKINKEICLKAKCMGLTELNGESVCLRQVKYNPCIAEEWVSIYRKLEEIAVLIGNHGDEVLEEELIAFRDKVFLNVPEKCPFKLEHMVNNGKD